MHCNQQLVSRDEGIRVVGGRSGILAHLSRVWECVVPTHSLVALLLVLVAGEIRQVPPPLKQ